MIKRPQKYVPNLQKMQAVCARNYALLLRLLPMEYAQDASWDIKCDKHLEFQLKVIERSRYTDTLSIIQLTSHLPKFMVSEFEVRVYHDAQMAEVIGFQKHKRLRQNYPYPNAKLHHKDEKYQVNSLLKDWLNLVFTKQNELTNKDALMTPSV
ncbi:hypothetical protein GCM10008107_10100 [Psychrosphaera saromensis]|uniref:Dehydrogenase n=1 Tax=Psychrosphaera saromensis TaxID=716813 RepID=A0A2S7UWR3_9GAMM|nr:DUF1249 domain-containing protein [Psychrosphaera saromensis]PQJ53710.1 hypothetical protein BTO11_08540 [Psychrosphaera saromensis]GHB62982.1 hypothetical protein GCM10008107_10100 [Psychrosphaera saromensis]GLQ15513.1 hypothetical protein GCM10007917_29680 [Psychrosphaera saromensis]